MRTPHSLTVRSLALIVCILAVWAALGAYPVAAQNEALRGKIVYVSARGGGSTNVSTLQDWEQLDLYVMNADGSDAHRIDTGLSAHYNPQWSADGASILLAGWPGGIFTVDANTDRLQSIGRLGYSAAWSPDEQLIAYSTMDCDMLIMNADGSDSHRISPKLELRGDFPSWSPDGQQVMFSYAVTPVDTGYWLSVLVRIDADGANLSLLDQRRGFIPFEAIPVGTPLLPATDGEWSPDGQKIVFASQDDIYIAYSDGTGLNNLTAHEAYDRDPSWSPDGSHILFASDRAGSYDLYVMDAYGDNVRRLTSSESDEIWADWWAPPPGSEPEPTPTRSGTAAGHCTANSSRTINLRTGPGTEFDVARQMAAGETVEIDGQATGSDGLVWYRLTTGEWARQDVIDEAAECLDVPQVAR